MRNRRSFDQIYRNFIRNRIDFDSLVIGKKRLIISKHMAGDIDNLALLIKKVSGKDRNGTDITLYGLRKALVELLSFFPVYRSYINGKVFSNDDRMHLQKAISDAKSTDPGLSREFAFIERFLLLQYEPYSSEQEKQEWTNVVMRFQQFTGPLMAKGFEDTVLYIYNRLVSLNEVGGWPQVFGIGPEIFHQFNSRHVRNWPNSMNTTSTHDTKRGEDFRARVNVLSEIPHEWERLVKQWGKINQKHKVISGENLVPDTNDEYLLYQTLIGSYPFNDNEYEQFAKRVCEYMLKAVREAKVHTGWVKHDSEYEDGLVVFVNKILDKSLSVEFFDTFIPFQKRVSSFGFYNSLSQCILKITSPGLPDFYQGTELWDLSLVDPDNRRSVDYETRIKILAQLKEVQFTEYKALIGKLIDGWADGKIKMFLIYRCLRARNENRELFQSGAYIPLRVKGTFKDSVIAFARKYEGEMAVVAVPRFLVSVITERGSALTIDVWKDTVIELPDSSTMYWQNAITGEEHETRNSSLYVGDIFQTFPGAIVLGK